MFSYGSFSRAKCCFTHSRKIKWNFKINEKWQSTIKNGVLNNLYKIIDVYLHKYIIMNHFHFHIHILYKISYF